MLRPLLTFFKAEGEVKEVSKLLKQNKDEIVNTNLLK